MDPPKYSPEARGLPYLPKFATYLTLAGIILQFLYDILTSNVFGDNFINTEFYVPLLTFFMIWLIASGIYAYVCECQRLKNSKTQWGMNWYYIALAPLLVPFQLAKENAVPALSFTVALFLLLNIKAFPVTSMQFSVAMGIIFYNITVVIFVPTYNWGLPEYPLTWYEGLLYPTQLFFSVHSLGQRKMHEHKKHTHRHWHNELRDD